MVTRLQSTRPMANLALAPSLGSQLSLAKLTWDELTAGQVEAVVVCLGSRRSSENEPFRTVDRQHGTDFHMTFVLHLL